MQACCDRLDAPRVGPALIHVATNHRASNCSSAQLVMPMWARAFGRGLYFTAVFYEMRHNSCSPIVFRASLRGRDQEKHGEHGLHEYRKSTQYIVHAPAKPFWQVLIVVVPRNYQRSGIGENIFAYACLAQSSRDRPERPLGTCTNSTVVLL